MIQGLRSLDRIAQVWKYGDTITRREVMGLSPIGDGDTDAPWFDKAWLKQQVRVIEHSEDQLGIYVEPDSPFTFPRPPRRLALLDRFRSRVRMLVHQPSDSASPIWHGYGYPRP